MNPTKKSFTVSLPREGNYETFPLLSETCDETFKKPTSLKALAARVLARNKEGNFNETCTKQGGNFPPENDPQKFHSFTGGNQGATTLPEWCRADCPGLETIPLPCEGETAGCVHPVTGTWRRLEWMSGCPAMEKRTDEDRQAPATELCDTISKADSTEEQSAYFAAAWPWIKEHKAELLAAGWTMPELVRRAKFRWPCGPWGLAWLPVWSRPGVVVTLERGGAIVFSWRNGERTIKQTARQ